jgi:GTP-binding protein HflX
LEQRLSEIRVVLDVILDLADGAGVSWLHRHTEVIHKSVRDDGQLAIRVRADPANAERARARFGLR